MNLISVCARPFALLATVHDLTYLMRARMQNFGSDHLRMLKDQVLLATVLRNQGGLEESEKILRSATTKYQEVRCSDPQIAAVIQRS